MPLLWGDDIIGWANASIGNAGLEVNAGFHGSRPRDNAFRNAFDEEVARLEMFLEIR
jgi:hypothetical protein